MAWISATDAGEGNLEVGGSFELDFLGFDHPLPQPHPCRLVHVVEGLQPHEDKLVHAVVALIIIFVHAVVA